MVGDKLNLVQKARISPKGVSGSGLLDQVTGKVSEWAGGAVSDALGDFAAEGIGGKLGGVVGGEVGSVVGGWVNESLGNILPSNAVGSAKKGEGIFSGPAKILAKTKGLVFPNTPMIQSSHQATWEDYGITHTNYGYYAYKNSRPSPIQVTGKFTMNTRTEADYFLGCVHFLRIATKMNYGRDDTAAGTPPPVMEFFAMGQHMFSNVPVVITNFQLNYEDNIDYVISGLYNKGTFTPVSTSITVEMQPYYNPSDQYDEFTLQKFKQATLLKSGYI
jgi:hypothetical protein